MPKTLITAPTVEPVSLVEAKEHLNVTSSDDDALIDSLIIASREYVENYLQRALATQTWDIFLDAFSNKMEISLPPLQSITSIKYIDTDGNEQTLSSSIYSVDTAAEPGIIRLAYNQSWPSTRPDANAVTIRAVCGYGNSWNDIPKAITQAIKLLIGHWYEVREPVVIGTITGNIPFTVESLLYPYRIIRF